MDKRVLLFTLEYPPFAGGVGTHSYEMARYAANAGIEVTVLAPDFHTDCSRFDSLQHFKTFRFHGNGSKRDFPILVPTLHRYLQRCAGEFDFVYCTHMLAQLAANTLWALMRFPFCITAYGTEVLYYRHTLSGRLLAWRLYDRAFATAAFSNYTRELILRSFPQLQVNKVFVEWPGVDSLRFALGQDGLTALRYRLGIPDSSFVLLSVGRLDPRKGHDMVIKALAQLVNNGLHSVRYVIAGVGKHEPALRQLVARLGLLEYVVFVGNVPYDSPDLIGFYDMCDVFVLPSRQERWTVEGFGIVFNEAAARGKPSIGGRHGGVPEAIVDGVTGVLVDPTDYNVLANIIRRMMEEPEWCRTLGDNARRRALGELRWDQVTLRTYRRFLDRWAPSA